MPHFKTKFGSEIVIIILFWHYFSRSFGSPTQLHFIILVQALHSLSLWGKLNYRENKAEKLVDTKYWRAQIIVSGWYLDPKVDGG